MKELDKLLLLQKTFNQLFVPSLNTELVFGLDEPFYKAPTESNIGQIQSREDFLSSALHEIAHWCIAGTERLKLDDFGYWYEPDGRTEAQQKLFEQVEVKPQAVERHLTEACQHIFRCSADNLNSNIGLSKTFEHAVERQYQDYKETGLPLRAQQLINELHHVFAHKCVDTVEPSSKDLN